MSSSLLIYIGESQKFDLKETVSATSTIPGISNPREVVSFGAVFRCEYEALGRSTLVDISSDVETVSVHGLGNESVKSAIELLNRLNIDLRVIDTDYSFDISIKPLSTIEEFKRAAGMYL